jgi:hypothetical protein
MTFRGSTLAVYFINGEEVGEVDDDDIQRIEDHMITFLEGQYPDRFDYGDMVVRQEQDGVNIYNLTSDDDEEVRIPVYETQVGSDTIRIEFAPLTFRQVAGKRRKRRQTRKRKHKTKKTRRATRRKR